MTTIVFDPGHGGHDPGAVGPTGLNEKDVVLAVAREAGAQLAARGLTVLHTRTDNTFVTLDGRCSFANTRAADLFVSLHCNSATNNTATGTETYAYSAGGAGDRLARAIQTRLVRELGLRDRGVKYANFAVLRGTSMPAALTEIAFLNNPSEEALLRDPAFQRRAATAIATGVLAHVGSAGV